MSDMPIGTLTWNTHVNYNVSECEIGRFINKSYSVSTRVKVMFSCIRHDGT